MSDIARSLSDKTLNWVHKSVLYPRLVKQCSVQTMTLNYNTYNKQSFKQWVAVVVVVVGYIEDNNDR